MERISWDDYFMHIAELAACRSICERLHVGCVLVRGNIILSTGYNGHIPGAPHISHIRDNHEQSTIHAEINSIANCAKNGTSTNDSSAYITHYPCINCAKALAAAGIKNIFYLNDYKNDPLVSILLGDSGIEIIKILPKHSMCLSPSQCPQNIHLGDRAAEDYQ
jgi:dCMP deaminase